MTWSRMTVLRDGVRLECRDRPGPGPSVVLLHGLAGHAGEWDGTARWLSPRHRVVAVDQRGHGASERRPGDVSRAAYVDDAVAVITRSGSGPVILVGQSLGGHTAMLTAAARPDLVRALVLVEAGPGGPNPGVPADIGAWLDSWPVPFPSVESAAAFLGGGPVGRGWAEGLERRDDGWWPRFDRDVMVASLRENAERAFWQEWDALRCPTLVVLAEKGIIGPEEAEEMCRRQPRAVAVGVPGAGHDVHLERPDALRQAMAAFLDGLG